MSQFEIPHETLISTLYIYTHIIHKFIYSTFTNFLTFPKENIRKNILAIAACSNVSPISAHGTLVNR